MTAELVVDAQAKPGGGCRRRTVERAVDGGCVVRYDSTGVETARLAVPTSRPTCVAFGGAALDRLFVSTVRIGLGAEALRSQPARVASSR